MGLTINDGVRKLVSRAAELIFPNYRQPRNMPGGPSDVAAVYVQTSEGDSTPRHINVSPLTASMVPAANSCVNILSGTIARLEFQVRPKRGGGEPLYDHPVAALLETPSATLNKLTFWEAVGRELHTRGDSYIRIQRNSDGYGVNLELARCDATQRNSDGWWYRLNRMHPDGMFGTVMTDDVHERDVIHIKGAGYDWETNESPSPISYAGRNALGSYMAAQRHAQIAMLQGHHSPAHIETDPAIPPDRIKLVRADFEDNYQGERNAGKTPILPPGFKIVKTGFTSQDIQLIAVLKFQITDIARTWNIPLFLLQHFEQSTGGWANSNLSEQWTNFVRFSLNTHVRRYTDEFNLKLIPADQRMLYTTYIDRDPLVAGDLQQKALICESLVSKAAVWTPEEGREFTGKPAAVPAGQKLRQPTGAPKQDQGSNSQTRKPADND